MDPEHEDLLMELFEHGDVSSLYDGGIGGGIGSSTTTSRRGKMNQAESAVTDRNGTSIRGTSPSSSSSFSSSSSSSSSSSALPTGSVIAGTATSNGINTNTRPVPRRYQQNDPFDSSLLRGTADMIPPMSTIIYFYPTHRNLTC